MTASLDLVDVDSLLTEEEVDVRATARRFADERLRPSLPEWFESATIPARELAKELGALGFLGMHLTGYGCAGPRPVAYGLACLEIEAADSGMRSLVSVQGSLAMYAIWKYGSEEQKTEWLPRMAAGEAIGCFGLTEPDFGSNPAGMRTNARRDGDDWVLNGSKMWITNGSVADVAVVWARTDDGRPRLRRTDRRRQGSRRRRSPGRCRCARRSRRELVLDDVRLPASALLPEARGLSGPLGCLNEARFGIIFGAMGAARDCLETAVAYAGERIVFDKPLAGYQLTQAKLADMAVELNKGTLLAVHLGRLKEKGDAAPRAGQRRQAQQRPRGDRDRARVPHDPGRERHQRRVPDHAARQQPRVRPHLRGHVRGPPARDRPGPHRPGRLPLTARRPPAQPHRPPLHESAPRYGVELPDRLTFIPRGWASAGYEFRTADRVYFLKLWLTDGDAARAVARFPLVQQLH